MAIIEKLGNFIEKLNRPNTNLHYGIDDVCGITNAKKLVLGTKANLIGRTFEKFTILAPREFIFNRRTSRNGERISLGFNTTDREWILTEDYCHFRVRKDKENILDPDFLYLFFLNPEFDRYARFNSWGSATEFFNWEEIIETPIPVPPITEQRKIVRDYQVITNRIALLRKMNEIYVEIVRHLYRKHFEQNDWPVATMESLCSKIGSGATPRGGKETYCESGISFIRSTNVYDYFFSYLDLAYINDGQAEALANVVVEANDVLFNITGVSIARCCMVPSDVLPARVNQHVMILRPKSGKYMSYYLLFTLCNQSNKNLLLGIGQSGSTREAINKQEMEDFKVPLPPEKEILVFGKQAETFLTNVQRNMQEISVLQGLQDILLAQVTTCKTE